MNPGHSATQVDLWDVLDWVRTGKAAELVLGTDGPAAIVERIVRPGSANEDAGAGHDGPAGGSIFGTSLRGLPGVDRFTGQPDSDCHPQTIFT